MGDRDHGRGAWPLQRHVDDAAGDVDRHETRWLRQEALKVGGPAVDVDLAHVQAANIEDRVPGRRLDFEFPWAARVQLDLSPTYTTETAPHHLFAAHARWPRPAAISPNADQPLH